MGGTPEIDIVAFAAARSSGTVVDVGERYEDGAGRLVEGGIA